MASEFDLIARYFTRASPQTILAWEMMRRC